MVQPSTQFPHLAQLRLVHPLQSAAHLPPLRLWPIARIFGFGLTVLVCRHSLHIFSLLHSLTVIPSLLNVFLTILDLTAQKTQRNFQPMTAIS